MVIDAAKGIEQQTRKLFEVCRLRDVPIVTFVNKMDREARDPFDILDEIEQSLALDVTPASWPIGMGRDFLGCYDILNDQLVLMPKGKASGSVEDDDPGKIEKCQGLDDPKLDELLPDYAVAKLREEVEMARLTSRPTAKDISARYFLAARLIILVFGNCWTVSENMLPRHAHNQQKPARSIQKKPKSVALSLKFKQIWIPNIVIA